MISKDTTFVIVGLGLLGGSYAKGLKEAGYRVYGIARQSGDDRLCAQSRADRRRFN